MFRQKFLWLSITPFAFPVVPEVYIMAATSSGRGFFLLERRSVSTPGSFRMVNVSMSIAVRPFRPLILGSSLCETNMALASGCSSMLRISFSEDSGRMGTAILPNAVAAKMLCPSSGCSLTIWRLCPRNLCLDFPAFRKLHHILS